MDSKPHSTIVDTAREAIPNHPNGILELIKDKIPYLTKSEKRVGQYLLADPLRLANTSGKEVANAVGVSEPTVVRFCRNVGCAGFKDLKLLLMQHLAVKQAFRDSEIDRLPKSGTYIERLHHVAEKALKQAAHAVDARDIETAAKIIAASGRLFIYGVGGSSAALAEEAHNRFFRLKIASSTFTDSYLQRMSASTLSEKDAVLLISSTGRPRSLIESLELARHYGAKSVTIAPKQSPLANNADVCLETMLSQTGVAPHQPSPMRYSQLFVLDCLAHRVAVLLGGRADESLERVRASIAMLHGIVPEQPIGD